MPDDRTNIEQRFGKIGGFVVRINICGKNRHLRQGSNR